jgi:subfamily B ATP-binding cassette protein MsbA
MNHVRAVCQFSLPYLRRYAGRLLAGLLLSVVFGASNASFVWAAKTLTQRFSPTPTPLRPEVPGAEPSRASTRVDLPSAASAPSAPVFTRALETLGQRIQAGVDPWLPRAGRELDWRQCLGLFLFLPLLVGIRASSDYFSNYCMGWVSERVIRDMRLDLMEKLSALSLDFFTRSSTGDLLTRINTDTANLLRSLRVGGADLLKESVTLVAVVGYLLWLDWKLTLATMVCLPLCLFPLSVLGKKARRAMRASLDATVAQSSQLVELVTGIRVIKAFNLEQAEISRFRQTSGQLVRAGMKGVQAKELINPLIEIVSMFGLGALFLYVFATGGSGAELAGFLAGVLLLYLPIKKLSGVHILFEQASMSVRRLIDLMREEPKVKDPPAPKPLTTFRDRLQFERVSFAYGAVPVVRDLSLTIPRGLKLGVAGESGSGKTTLLNLIFRFYDPTSGRVTIDGIDLRDVAVRDLRALMALVSQEVVLFDQTVAENIACGKPGATRAEVEAAARAAFAHEFICQLPQGYDTRVGERGTTLSGGQRQRLAIARAFVRDAPILVLDEATAALDSKAEAEVQAALDRLAEHRTVICVAHRLSTLSSMDRIIVLRDGRLIEEGSFEKLLQAGGAFAEMAARQGIRLAGPGGVTP